MTTLLYFLLCLSSVISIPVDDPIRIDLPVYDQPRSSSNVVIAQPLEQENHPGSSKTVSSAAGNLIPDKNHDDSNVLTNKLKPHYPAVS